MEVNLHKERPGRKLNGAFKMTSRMIHRHIASG